MSPKLKLTPAPVRPERRKPWEQIGLSSRADSMASDIYDLTTFSLGELFSVFLGCYGEDGDPVESAMLHLANELDALRHVDEDGSLPQKLVPRALAICAARARVVAELHRRMAQAPEASDG